MANIYNEKTTPPSHEEWLQVIEESPFIRSNPYLQDSRTNLAEALDRRGYHFEARTLLSGKLVPIIGREYFPSRLPAFSVLDNTAASHGVELIHVTPQPKTDGWLPASLGIDPAPSLMARLRWKRSHYVASFKNGECVVSPWGYAIFSQDHHYASDFCFNDGPMIAWSGVVPEAIELTGTVAVIAQSWSNAVHHWNMESVPRFELLRLAALTENQVDHYVVRNIEPWHLEYTDRLGIPREKLRALGQVFHVRADRLLVCSNVEQADWGRNPPDLEPEPWVCSLLGELVPDPDPQQLPSEKIYISRASAGSRRVFNEGELRRFLEDNGFRTVFFENLGLDEKANVMRSAEIVISPAGAALTYVPFMRPGTKCIVLYSDDLCGSTFRDISANCGVTHIHAIFPSMTRFFPSVFVPAADHLREQIIDIKHLCDVMEVAKVKLYNKPLFQSFRNR